MNRREHSHLCICTQSVTFSRNVYRQSLYMEPVAVSGFEFRRTLPPTFLFLQYSVFKEQTLNSVAGRGVWLRAQSSVAHAALLISTRANSSVASGAPPSLLRYIVGGQSGCQQRIPGFLNFLRQPVERPQKRGFPARYER